ncbi:BnaC03g63430D [Brassica napus]|uniref:BnaC03g63430D protein n=1 Tax=Brassica napus TaxID=3708 RepID=A0A078FBM2_BRANA|nr:BnaC03g63430D [Brassica napus]
MSSAKPTSLIVSITFFFFFFFFFFSSNPHRPKPSLKGRTGFQRVNSQLPTLTHLTSLTSSVLSLISTLKTIKSLSPPPTNQNFQPLHKPCKGETLQ